MPRRSEYPDAIERKVVDAVGDDGFRTPDQRDAAAILEAEWPAEFSDLADAYDYSRSHFSNVFYRYFGPPEEPETFDEIYDEFETLDDYWRHKEREELLGQLDRQELSEREIELYERGLRTGFELAVEKLMPELKDELNIEELP